MIDDGALDVDTPWLLIGSSRSSHTCLHALLCLFRYVDIDHIHVSSYLFLYNMHISLSLYISLYTYIYLVPSPIPHPCSQPCRDSPTFTTSWTIFCNWTFRFSSCVLSSCQTRLGIQEATLTGKWPTVAGDPRHFKHFKHQILQILAYSDFWSSKPLKHQSEPTPQVAKHLCQLIRFASQLLGTVSNL